MIMSLQNHHPTEQAKGIIGHHPWQDTIKREYADKIKYAHNSINNPMYPKLKKKPEGTRRMQFTVIGNRVTKGFIFCMHIVKGLYKWRRKLFDAPVIRGTTSVEWPSVWRDVKLNHGGLAHCLSSQVVVLINDKLLGGEQELKDFVEKKFVYHLTLDYHKEGVAQFASYIKSCGRPCAYMHISVDGEYIGTLIFMLYADLVPNTCENFLRLCKEKKGGYGGTPIHRIVKDGWIQCGGFGLKATDLDCENFIVPHDRRGVLCMANTERHVDCSTQFFVLLQPALWLAHKYVAFGQLIDGESTLSKIEKVPTWYESPTSEIIIHQAGILNLDCHDFIINKGTKEYIHSHIENLSTLGDLLYEELLQKVFLELEFKNLQRLTQGGAEEIEAEEDENNIHPTKKFHTKKEDLKKLQESEAENRHSVSFASDADNNDFDVEMYEPEEYSYQHASIINRSVSVSKPEKLYFLPLTDVPYPGEVDSTYDLKKLLKGDYCLESDLQQIKQKVIPPEIVAYISDIIDVDEIQSSSAESLDPDEEKELRKYIKMNAERISFAGHIIKNIGKTAGSLNIHRDNSHINPISDEGLRKLRIVSAIYDEVTINAESKDKKVSICAPKRGVLIPREIKRRQTGFVRPEDLEKVHVIHKSASEIADLEEAALRKVRISPSSAQEPGSLRQARRPTGFVHATAKQDSDVDIRKSVLNRLFDEVACDSDVRPTLKNYRPMSEIPAKNIFLLKKASKRMDDSETKENRRRSMTYEQSVQDILNMQHGLSLTRKISSDYVKTIGHIEQHPENSLRSVEFAKTRPAMTVSEYQMKNQKNREELKYQKIQPSSLLSMAGPVGKGFHEIRLIIEIPWCVGLGCIATYPTIPIYYFR